MELLQAQLESWASENHIDLAAQVPQDTTSYVPHAVGIVKPLETCSEQQLSEYYTMSMAAIFQSIDATVRYDHRDLDSLRGVRLAADEENPYVYLLYFWRLRQDAVVHAN